MFPTDPAHVKSVGSGGPDLPFNLIPLCRTCHVMQHKTGWVTLFKTNAKIGAALKNRGWYLINEKLFNDHFSDIHVLRMQKHTD